MKRFLLLAALLSAPALAQDTPRDLRDMVGARAGQAEGELQRRGYRNVGGEKGDDRSYTYWWNADRRQCVTIATMEGRYNSITTSPAPDCEQRNSVRDRDRGRDRDRDHRPPTGSVAPYELSQLCRGQAATRFDRRPSEITVNAPIRQRSGSLVQGWFDREGKRTTFFTCRFDEDDRFVGVF
ncbi:MULTISPECIES: hypothetical protein [Sphingomonas]|uniref:hypothetical protein n=1 Tax=Sphingomonas TaxID=13687 RepID=UPI0019D1C224|nr:hypothetical protein [Sphingomonas sp. ABOLF]GLK20667.1 hypothetical protein GCM10017606_14930 [Microbacterium terregens]